MPKYKLAQEGAPGEIVYQFIHDELNLDGNTLLNLASYVTTWMDPHAEKLIVETLNKNYVDQEEYPQTTEIHNRCVNILAHLLNAPCGEDSCGIGTGTVGSSEAIHLAGLALKWRWRKRREAKNKSSDKPNIVMSHTVQVCWEKFARYFDVEPRYVPVTKGNYILDVEKAVELVDENTIAVVGILGNTYTGQYEPIQELNAALTELNEKTGWEVPIHVDAASGGFVAPFTNPEFAWDFRLPLVKSINLSGHKYGLVYPGVGWVLWRSAEELPEDLIFHVNYLGSDQPTFNLNFSRGASHFLAQYYNFLHLGFDGYRRIMLALLDLTQYLTEKFEATGRFEILNKLDELPVIAISLKEGNNYTVFQVSDMLRSRGWTVPAYTMAPDAEDVSLLRIVIREGFNRDLADILLTDINWVCDQLEQGITIEPTEKSNHAHKIKGRVC